MEIWKDVKLAHKSATILDLRPDQSDTTCLVFALINQWNKKPHSLIKSDESWSSNSHICDLERSPWCFQGQLDKLQASESIQNVTWISARIKHYIKRKTEQPFYQISLILYHYKIYYFAVYQDSTKLTLIKRAMLCNVIKPSTQCILVEITLN